MVQPEKLEFRNWWSTLRDWGPLDAALKRHDGSTRPILRQHAHGLINELVRRHPNFDVKTFLQRALPAAAEQLSPRQFTEAMELALRLVDGGVDPTYTLQSGLPGLAQKCRTADSFKANSLYLEALVTHLHRQDLDTGKTFFVAVRAAAKELDTRQLTTSLVLCTRLAEHGINPSDALRFAIPAAAVSLNTKQFRLAMTLATHAARRGCDISELLGNDLPQVAREVSPDELTQALRLAVHLEEKDIGISSFFRTGLPALVEVGKSPAEFNRILQTLGTLLVRLRDRGIKLDVPVTATCSGCDTSDDFLDNMEALYRFAQKMHEQRVDPNDVLRRGFPPTVAHTPESFQTTLQNLISVVVRLRETDIDDNLLAYIVEYGLDRVAKVSPTAEEYRTNLITLMKSFRHLVMQPLDAQANRKAITSIRNSPASFVNATDALTSDQLLAGGLCLVYELAANRHLDWTGLAPRKVASLAGEVLKLEEGTVYTVGVDEGRQPRIDYQLTGAAAFRSRARPAAENHAKATAKQDPP